MKYTIESKTAFYVGDPCYVLPDETYYEVWGETHDFQNGIVEVPNTGLSFAVVSTAIGDGVYPGMVADIYSKSSFEVFPVDSGTIAIIPVELIDPEKLDQDESVVLDFAGPVTIEEVDEDGTIAVNCSEYSVTISVAPEEEEEEGEEDAYAFDVDWE